MTQLLIYAIKYGSIILVSMGVGAYREWRPAEIRNKNNQKRIRDLQNQNRLLRQSPEAVRILKLEGENLLLKQRLEARIAEIKENNQKIEKGKQEIKKLKSNQKEVRKLEGKNRRLRKTVEAERLKIESLKLQCVS